MRAASFWWTTRWLSLWKLYLVESEMGEPKVIIVIPICETLTVGEANGLGLPDVVFLGNIQMTMNVPVLWCFIYIYIVPFLVHPRMDEDDSWRSSASFRYLGMLSIGSTTWKSTTETSVVPISQMPGSFPTAPSIGSPMKMSLERAGSFVPTTACRKR